jgi:hypothetical protein
MKLKYTKVTTLAATLIIFGSLAGGANAAVIFSNPGGKLNVTFTDAVDYTVNSSHTEDFYHLVIRDVYTSDQPSNFANTVANSTVTLTHINSGSANATPNDSAQYSGISGYSLPDNNDLILGFRWSSDLTVTSGDTFTLSAGTYSTNRNIALPDSNAASFDTLLIDGFRFNQVTSVQTLIPEPSSALLVGLSALGLAVARRRTS